MTEIPKDGNPPGAVVCRDVFLSHRSLNKPLVRELSAGIEAELHQGRNLTTWLDEAEIRPGQSVTGMVNYGLEHSRFIALVMTPDYFTSESGWTHAEWHAALYVDPDNRRGRIIPILAADCPYVPVLLRHLRVIDLRGSNYARGLRELLSVLQDTPLPRPVVHRGQLLDPSGRVARATLMAERSVIDADPDAVSEKLFCNLLPVERKPQYIYVAPIAKALRRTRADGTEAMPSKNEIKEKIRSAQVEAKLEHPFMPAFRLRGDKIITFHDLHSPDIGFSQLIDDDAIEQIPTDAYVRQDDDRNIVLALLNMALSRHAVRRGLAADETKNSTRFLFPPVEGKARTVTWLPQKRWATRKVAKPCCDKTGRLLFWIHQAAYLRIVWLANRFYLKIRSTWVVTDDGVRVRTGPKVGATVIKWTGRERNLHLLYHVRFWATYLRRGRGPFISVSAGDQNLEISVLPAFIHQAYGIADDHSDLLGLLDQEASQIAQGEEEITQLAIEAGLEQEEEKDATAPEETEEAEGEEADEKTSKDE